MTRRHRALALALLLGACGDSGSGTTSSAGTEDAGGIDSLGVTSSISTSGSDTDSGTTAGGPVMCESESDCDITEICNEGVCMFDGNWCGGAAVDMQTNTAPNVMLVLDKSGSMVNDNNNWDDDADDANDDGFKDSDPMTPATPKVTRWRSLHEVVELIGTQYDGNLNLGAQLFPSVDAVPALGPDACLVNSPPEVPVAPTNASSVLAGIPGASDTSLAGGTPAERGVASAVDHLLGLPDPMTGEDKPQSLIIFITDGSANCSTNANNDDQLLEYDANLVPTITDALAQGIATYVIGVDIENAPDNQGINPFEVLNDAAVAGGRPKDDPTEKFYNTVNKIELQEALQGIIGGVLPCIIQVPGDQPDMTTLRIEVGGDSYPDPLPDGADCATETGWRYTDGSETFIELCGAACNAYQQSGEMSFNYDCPPLG
ncbi:MAG: hypothetical protein H6713_04795 [Myxococcales bacterium]|nr:hypothetical protein [Myxococcales bacterium]MCB9749310.1 hypothetical protein [Myxococcales bacterium]